MFGFCFLSAVPMRSNPSDRAEMVNQLLYADTFDLVETTEKWTRVRLHHDGYEGWVDNKQFAPYTSAASLAYSLFLGTPYLWGGRSLMGIDCSGLTQVCFKAMNIALPRDASQQVLLGHEVPLAEVREDDLAFFANVQGHIVHVGICMGDGRIVHASGQVRIDRLDQEGIFVERTATYSHHLHTIHRMV